LVGSALAEPDAEVPVSRDHRKLRVFHDAHALTLVIYKQTRDFPKDEWFGIRAQMRRAAVSVATNLVEGNARPTTPDYLHFLYIALASACELAYLVKLSGELGYSGGNVSGDLQLRSEAVVKQLQRLTQTTERWAAAEKALRSRARPETKDQRP
jgi:four helix bundle protein